MGNQKIRPQVKIILIYLAMQVIPLLITWMLPDAYLLDASIYSTWITYAVGTLWMLTINYKEDFHTSLDHGISLPLFAVILWGIIGFFLLIIFQQVAGLIELHVFGQSPESLNTQVILETIRNYPFYLILVTLFAPLAEELVFRKAIFGWLYDYLGGLGAGLISSLIFAVVHMDGHLLLYTMMGIILSFLYYRTRNIAAPMIAHVLMNVFATLPLIQEVLVF